MPIRPVQTAARNEPAARPLPGGDHEVRGRLRLASDQALHSPKGAVLGEDDVPDPCFAVAAAESHACMVEAARGERTRFCDRRLPVA